MSKKNRKKNSEDSGKKVMQKTVITTGLISGILLVLAFVCWSRVEPIASIMDVLASVQSTPSGLWIFTPLGGLIGGLVFGCFYFSTLISVATYREMNSSVSGWNDIIILLGTVSILSLFIFNWIASLVAIGIGVLFTYYLQIAQ
ncbi:MAG: hypothetical protein ACTSUV_02965 [Candidatus Ranarchaeia archaeon]